MSFRTSFKSGQTYRAFIVFVLLFINLVGCREQVDPVTTPKQPIAVDVIALTKVDETMQTAKYFGALTPNRSLTLGFTVPGKIKSIAKRGQTIASNELLAELDVDIFEEQKKSLESRLSQNSNQQQIQQLQQQIVGLDEQIQARRIFAPFDCVAEEILTFENSLVRAQSPVVKIIDLKNPKVKINLPRRVANFIHSDHDVYFLLGDKAVIGKLVEKSKTESVGSIFCWFDIETDLSNIEYKFGQTVEASFNFQTGNSGYWLPLGALDRSGEGIWSVLLVESNNGQCIILRKLVTIVQVTDDKALIDGNFLDGAVVVADGIHRVVPGQEVETQLIRSGETSVKEEVRE